MNDVARARSEGTVLGIPLGDLGGFQTALMSLAAGFAAFFLATFCAIVGMLVYMTASGKHPDFARTYRYFGLPAGVIVFVIVGGTLGSLWVRRRISGARRR